MLRVLPRTQLGDFDVTSRHCAAKFVQDCIKDRVLELQRRAAAGDGAGHDVVSFAASKFLVHLVYSTAYVTAVQSEDPGFQPAGVCVCVCVCVWVGPGWRVLHVFECDCDSDNDCPCQSVYVYVHVFGLVDVACVQKWLCS